MQSTRQPFYGSWRRPRDRKTKGSVTWFVFAAIFAFCAQSLSHNNIWGSPLLHKMNHFRHRVRMSPRTLRRTQEQFTTQPPIETLTSPINPSSSCQHPGYCHQVFPRSAPQFETLAAIDCARNFMLLGWGSSAFSWATNVVIDCAGICNAPFAFHQSWWHSRNVLCMWCAS